MSKCPNIRNMYYSQKELKNFLLEILVVYLELQQVLMNKFLC